jgi:hypothetical protein
MAATDPRSGTTFFPSDENRDLETLIEGAGHKREALFVGLSLKLKESHAQLVSEEGLASCVEDLQRRDPREAAKVMGHPVFALMLDEFLRTGIEGDETFGARIRTLSTAYLRAAEAVCSTEVLRLGNTELRRWDTDPLIAERAPPTYTFPPAAERTRRAATDAYSLETFAEIAAAALDRVRVVWPALHRQFDSVVRVIVHIPDAPYRSASAARYRGVVFLSSDDTTLLELEESLVHEFGHQILYHAIDAQPLLADEGPDQYTLPWSGSRRDFYGYLHAFYIYLLLALYLERALRGSAHKAAEVRPLFDHIVKGLDEAHQDFVPDDRFTLAGRSFVEALQRALDILHTRLDREAEVV